jgi:ATPase subunit of ABC transporter with duplicated ATPase domains
LSGGERFRAVLAALLSAQPAPQLLMLDEPTNNLDLASVAQLERALDAYRGALIVASHDLPFLRRLGITRWLHMAQPTHDQAMPARQVLAGFRPVTRNGGCRAPDATG